MAFNKFMHPRNRYKDNKPNFDELAKKYPDFGRHIVKNQCGNATLDFRDPAALRALTCTLLHEDFCLDVELPLDRLIPTLSLRLNYIHWIEDLLATSKHGDGQLIYGIDIGCGPSCIYPLLGSKMNGWRLLASEVDGLALHYARQNVTRNQLDDKINVIESTEDSMFQYILNQLPPLEQNRIYHFTMCNPPFYGNALEAQGIMGSRSMSRPEPKTVSTAAELEMIAEGGEVEFVRRMVRESLSLRKQIVWYTSMLGKKSSLGLIKEELRQHKIRNVTHTEFCQGRTMRWGIAWTFYEDFDPPLPASKRRKMTERCTPFTVPVPDTYIQRVQEAGEKGGLQNKIQAVARAMHTMMQDLQMSVERRPTSKWCAKFELTAKQDTWSHQRRRRRREKRQASQSPLGSASQKKRTPSEVPGTMTQGDVNEHRGMVLGTSWQGKNSDHDVSLPCGESQTKLTVSEAPLTSSQGDVNEQRETALEVTDQGKKGESNVSPPCGEPQTELSQSEAPMATSQGEVNQQREPALEVTDQGKKSDCNVSPPCGEPQTELTVSEAPVTAEQGDLEQRGTTLEATWQGKNSDHKETLSEVFGSTAASPNECDTDNQGPPRTSETISTKRQSSDTDFQGLRSSPGSQSHDGTSNKRQIEISPASADVPSTSCKRDSSTDDDENFPLEMRLDVKLGEKRAIVIEAVMSDASKRHILHQVVQYIKNQMK